MSTNIVYEDVEDWESRAWAQLPSGVEHGVITDCAVDAEDRLFIASRKGALVLIFDRTGRFVKAWGRNEPGRRPHGITLGPDGVVYLVSDDEHTVRKFTPDGDEIGVIGVSGVPSDNGVADWSQGLARRLLSIQRGGPPFNGPTRVAVAPNGDLYVADGYGNARIHQFRPDGTLVRSWGEPGNGPGQFYLPHGLAVTPDGRVLVADQQNDRVQVFTGDGVFLEHWTDLYHPMQIVVDKQLAYVAEGSRGSIANPNRPMPARISIFDLEGHVVSRFGEKGPHDPRRMIAPHGMAVDSRGNVYVAHLMARMPVGAPPLVHHTIDTFAPVAAAVS